MPKPKFNGDPFNDIDLLRYEVELRKWEESREQPLAKASQIVSTSQDELEGFLVRLGRLENNQAIIPVTDGGSGGGDGFAGVKNNREILYVKGSEDEDGSLRLIPDTIDGTDVQFQLRDNGVWNNTGIVISPTTLSLGDNCKLKAAGRWLHTSDVVAGFEALHPHIVFGDNGTEPAGVMPALDPLEVRLITQPNDAFTVFTTTVEADRFSADDILISGMYYRTGGLKAQAPITIEFRRDSQFGTVFWTKTLPASDFPGNSEIFIQLDGLLEQSAGETIYERWTSADTFSLKGAAFVGFWRAIDQFKVNTDDIITTNGGLDRILSSVVDCTAIIDNQGNMVLSGIR
jgi:hypothetical protein